MALGIAAEFHNGWHVLKHLTLDLTYRAAQSFR